MKHFGQLSNGGAVWTAMFFNSQKSVKYDRIEIGEITGSELMSGVDIDQMIEQFWGQLKQSDTCNFIEMYLMLISGKVVKIQSSFDGKRVRVLKVEFDRTTFPSGLKGRWVDDVLKEDSVSGKEGKKRSKRAG